MFGSERVTIWISHVTLFLNPLKLGNVNVGMVNPTKDNIPVSYKTQIVE